MLRTQKEKIKEKLDRYQSQLDVERRKKFMMKIDLSGATTLKQGYLFVQKKGTSSMFLKNMKRRLQGGWKNRYCVLTSETLCMYRDETRVGEDSIVDGTGAT